MSARPGPTRSIAAGAIVIAMLLAAGCASPQAESPRAEAASEPTPAVANPEPASERAPALAERAPARERRAESPEPQTPVEQRRTTGASERASEFEPEPESAPEPAPEIAEPRAVGAPEPTASPVPDQAGVSGAREASRAAIAPPSPPRPLDESPTQRPSATTPTVPPPPPDARDVAQIAPAYSEGLEVAWWTTKDQALATDLLASLPERPHPMDDAVRARWERAGFRILAIDETDVRSILETLEPVGRVERDWVGLKSRWTECFRPPTEARLDPRPISGMPRPIAPSRLRLIARAWLAPQGDDAVLRLDLAAQHHVPSDVFARITLDEPTLPHAELEGDIFDDATAEIALRAGQVLLITGESPGVKWGDAPEPAPAARAGAIPAEQFDPAIARAENQGGAEFGPPVVPPQSPGEAMLKAETSAIFPGPTRTILLLIPRVPDEYSLLVR